MSKIKGALHQLLAVEPDLVRNAKGRMKDCLSIFKKGDRFKGSVSVLKHFDEENTKLDKTVVNSLDTTVPEVLGYAFIAVAEAWDASMQKELTNQSAAADVSFDGVTLSGIPATGLLALESRLADLRDVLLAIPTLPPGREWDLDPQDYRDVYREKNVIERIKTEKVSVPVVLYEATEHHPAQVNVVNKDVPVGKYTDTNTVGAMSSVDKANMIDRLEKVLSEVKSARQRANATTVVHVAVGKEILTYIAGEDMMAKSPTMMEV